MKLARSREHNLRRRSLLFVRCPGRSVVGSIILRISGYLARGETADSACFAMTLSSFAR